jgi:hypothetical protein
MILASIPRSVTIPDKLFDKWTTVKVFAQ